MDKIMAVFFYEVINRIVPGLVFIGFYFNLEVEKAFCKFHNWNFFMVACILLAAWLIGFTIDAVLWIPYWQITELYHKKRSNKFNAANNGKNRGCFILQKAKHAEEVKDPNEYVRLPCIKDQSEKTMCRVLFIISIITLRYPPNGLIVKEWHTWYSWFGIGAFGIITILRFFNDRIDKDSNGTSNQSPESTSTI